MRYAFKSILYLVTQFGMCFGALSELNPIFNEYAPLSNTRLILILTFSNLIIFLGAHAHNGPFESGMLELC